MPLLASYLHHHRRQSLHSPPPILRLIYRFCFYECYAIMMHTTNNYYYYPCFAAELNFLVASPFLSIPWLFRHYCICTTTTVDFFHHLLLHFVAAIGKRGSTFGRDHYRIDQTNTFVFFRFAALDLRFIISFLSMFLRKSLLGENCIIKDHNKGPPDWTILGPKKMHSKLPEKRDDITRGQWAHTQRIQTIQMDFQSRWLSDAISLFS
ncbi:hypothetical protein GGI43DRAFT_267539 [Trichoderma evansii]